MALSFCGTIALAESKSTKSETYQDLIDKAYNLMLQKDRQQALTILSNALRKENKPQAIAEIKKTMSEIGHVFFSDKSQSTYETSVSLRKTEPLQALAKMQEAARIEPDNFDIVNELARLLLAKNDCSAAQELLMKQLKMVPFDEELNLSNGQSLACQGKWREFQAIYDLQVLKKSSLLKFWYPLEIERQLFLKNSAKALENLSTLSKSDPKYPEIPYWTWKIDEALQKKNHQEALKYVMVCKNISANQYRQYMMDPWLCRRTSEVDTELKGMNGTTQ